MSNQNVLNAKALLEIMKEVLLPEVAVYIDIKCNGVEFYRRFIDECIEQFDNLQDFRTFIFREGALMSAEKMQTVYLYADALVDKIFVCGMHSDVTGTPNSMMLAAMYLSNSEEDEHNRLASKIFQTMIDELYYEDTYCTESTFPSSALALITLEAMTGVVSYVISKGSVPGYIRTFSPTVPLSIELLVDKIRREHTLISINRESSIVNIKASTIVDLLTNKIKTDGIENAKALARMLVVLLVFDVAYEPREYLSSLYAYSIDESI